MMWGLNREDTDTFMVQLGGCVFGIHRDREFWFHSSRAFASVNGASKYYCGSM